MRITLENRLKILHGLGCWQSEIVAFKEAKGYHSSDKLGQYFSAVSNGCNLRERLFILIFNKNL